ncbi:hypothetical protein LCGC14_0188060 [marine sediment metagenome]|uniref:Uncharacterized protein n=1 Tax=marine sediment metagenome TaxID=412755 RepID=A0A0F9XQ27_9ZZZZ
MNNIKGNRLALAILIREERDASRVWNGGKLVYIPSKPSTKKGR